MDQVNNWADTQKEEDSTEGTTCLDPTHHIKQKLNIANSFGVSSDFMVHPPNREHQPLWDTYRSKDRKQPSLNDAWEGIAVIIEGSARDVLYGATQTSNDVKYLLYLCLKAWSTCLPRPGILVYPCLVYIFPQVWSRLVGILWFELVLSGFR